MKAIYIRTSTEEQEPENQIKDIELISGKDYLLFKDKQSAWKDNLDREQFTNLKKDIQLKKISELYVWDLDRIFRNRKKLIEFFELCKLYKCKIHSYRQQWLEQLNNIPEPFNEIMHSLMVQIMGWLAEEESNKKSERIKVSIRRNQGITSSYKGNKWGRKALKIEDAIIKAFNEGKSFREIIKEISYTDKNNHKKFVSIGYVHKTIKKFKALKDSQNL